MSVEDSAQPNAMRKPHTEMMAVEDIKKYRHVDRLSPEESTHTDPQPHIASLAKIISKGELENPLQIHYDHDSKWGVLREGHHRLLAAEQAGVTHLPVTVHRASPGSNSGYKEEGKGAPMSIKDDAKVGTFKEHIPAQTSPSSFENTDSYDKEGDKAKGPWKTLTLHKAFRNHPSELVDEDIGKKGFSYDPSQDVHEGWHESKEAALSEVKHDVAFNKDPANAKYHPKASKSKHLYDWDDGHRSLVTINTDSDSTTKHKHGTHSLDESTHHDVQSIEHHKVDPKTGELTQGKTTPRQWLLNTALRIGKSRFGRRN
jgi:hypothetical protein